MSGFVQPIQHPTRPALGRSALLYIEIQNGVGTVPSQTFRKTQDSFPMFVRVVAVADENQWCFVKHEISRLRQWLSCGGVFRLCRIVLPDEAARP
jgi:hypothetical protein